MASIRRSHGWDPLILGGTYQAELRPIGEKSGVTMGMAMTEKQGGSDVRANSTRAYPVDEAAGHYRLVGHKWFCSAPMSDGFLTLAYTDNGLPASSCRALRLLASATLSM